MSRFTILLAAAAVLAGCVRAQSARVLAPGKTQVGVGIARLTIDEDDDFVLHTGELRIAHGVSDGTEIAVEIARTPGVGQAFTNLAIAPKFRLSQSATSAISLSLPASLTWEESRLGDVGDGTLGAFPTLYAGVALSKQAELVAAPSLGIAKPMGKGAEGSVYGFGLSVGVRFGANSSVSGLLPWVGFLKMTPSGGNDGDRGITFLMVGVGVTAGD